jgi:hypothetical protein
MELKLFKLVLRPLLCIIAVAAMYPCAVLAQFDNPEFGTTLDPAVWKYAGRSFGGDDVYVNANYAIQIKEDPNAVASVVLVNRLNCSDEEAAKTREQAQSRCVHSFGYASWKGAQRFWCADDPSKHSVATYWLDRYDEYDAKGALVAGFSTKDGRGIRMQTIAPDTPYVRAREWLCSHKESLKYPPPLQ